MGQHSSPGNTDRRTVLKGITGVIGFSEFWAERQRTGRQDGLPESLTTAINRYRSVDDVAVGVLPEMLYKGSRYRIAVYLGGNPLPQAAVSWTGIKETTTVANVFNPYPIKGEQYWNAYDTQKVLVFRARTSVYDLVTDSDTVYAISSLAAPRPTMFFTADSSWDTNDLPGIQPSTSDVKRIEAAATHPIFVITGDKPWLNPKSDQDKYELALRAMMSTGTVSLLPEEIRDRLVNVNTGNDAITTAETILTDHDSKVVHDIVNAYLGNTRRFQTVKGFSEFADDIATVLDVLLRFSEYQLYASRRVQFLDRILLWNSTQTAGTLNPHLQAAMNAVRGEFRDIGQKFVNRFIEYLQEKVASEAVMLSKMTGKHLLERVGRYVARRYASSAVASAATGAAGMFLAGVALSKYIYETGKLYDSALKAKYAYTIGRELDRVADAVWKTYQRDAAPIRYETVADYRAADLMEFHAYGTFWMAYSAILNTRVAEIKGILHPTGRLSQRQQRFLDKAERTRQTAQRLYFPALLDRVLLAVSRNSKDDRTWPMAGGGPARTGTVPGTTGPTPPISEKWTFKTGRAVRTSPAVVDGVVYIGSDDGNVYAIDAATGEAVWDQPFQTEAKVRSSPAVVDGVVYIGNNDDKLYAIDAATGDLSWNNPETIGSVTGKISTNPAVVDGVVYIGGDDTLYAFDAATGDSVGWSNPSGNSDVTSPAVADGRVYFGDGGGISAINSTLGEFEWSARTYGTGVSTPTVANNMVYAGNWHWGSINAFDIKTGELVWRDMWSMPRNTVSVPAVADGVVYVGSSGLFAFDAETGDRYWEQPFECGGIETRPAVADGIVYFGSGDSNVYGVDGETGDLVWNQPFQTGGSISASPAVADGVVYIGSQDRSVYALE